MASKKRNNSTSTQRSQTPAKSEPKPNNEGQLNQEKLETLANKAFDSVLNNSLSKLRLHHHLKTLTRKTVG